MHNQSSTINCTLPFDIETYHPYIWVFVLKGFIGLVIVIENVVVFTAIIQKWKAIIRQQNLYRYVLSLVAADLLNGIVLLLYSLFWIIAISYKIGIGEENASEIFRNFVTGVLFGLTFASLASAALLNLILRVTSTRALARAAAITSRSSSCFYRGSWVRSPRITMALITLIWIITLVFVIIPLCDHCEGDIEHCIKYIDGDPGWEYFLRVNGSTENVDSASEDCSILHTPVRKTYILVLIVFITLAWVLMILCNFFTTCVKTEVQKSPIVIDGRSHLKLIRKFGFSKDTSSIFAMIITLNMSISTLPYVIFSFVTETGSSYDQVYYGLHIDRIGVELVEMTLYISSIVNPFIYTALLSRLRIEVLRILKWKTRKNKKLVKLQDGNHMLQSSPSS